MIQEKELIEEINSPPKKPMPSWLIVLLVLVVLWALHFGLQ